MRTVPLVLLLVWAGVAAAAPPRPPAQRFAAAESAAGPPDPARRARVEAAAKAVETYLREQAKRLGLPSLAWGVVADGALVFAGGYGTRTAGGQEAITADTVFRIGSATKVCAGLALLTLRDAGKLDLDAPAARYLPELGTVVYPSRDSPSITVRHLVTHSSGLPRVGRLNYTVADHDVTEAELFAALRDTPLEFAPGTSTSYSNLAMALAGPIVTRVAREPFRAYVQRRLLAPLGMRATVWDRAAVPAGLLADGHRKRGATRVPGTPHWRFGASEAAGGLYSSVRDLARFVAFQLDAWPPRDAGEAGPLARATLRQSHLVFGPGLARPPTFGVNWVVMDAPGLGHVVFHNGSTDDYAASVWLLPRRGLGFIALAGSGESDDLDRISRQALEKLATAAPEPGPTLDRPMAVALERLTQLLARPDAAAVTRTISPRFFLHVSAAKVLELAQQIHAGVGRCTRHRVLRPTAVRLECERGALDVSLAVDPAPPHLIEELTIRSAK